MADSNNTHREVQKSNGEPGSAITWKAKWVKELFGLPTYFLATMTLVKISDGGNLLVVVIGLVPFVVTYNLLYKYFFPGHSFNGQWLKGMLFIMGQVLFWLLIMKLIV